MLYFVATPIGNLGDITFRAIEVLKSVDMIGCEDTRHSMRLLDYYEIKKPLFSYHKFNENEECDKIINLLNDGKNIAIISDAGMPLVSDPGNVLSIKLAENNIDYTIIPGATASLSALVLSGLDASIFTFIGFLPEKKKDKVEVLSRFKDIPSTLIFYAPPHDLNDILKVLFENLGARKCAVVKEITKIHEKTERFVLGEREIEDPKGEYIVVVEGQKEVQKEFELTDEEQINLYISRGMSKKEAIKTVAKERGISKNSLYKYTIND